MFPRQSIVFLFTLVLIATFVGGCGSQASQVTPPPAPTATAAPAPTATLAPGWKRFEGKGVSIALPDTFIGGDLTSADQDLIVENLKKLGNDYAQIADLIKSNPDLYLLYCMDTKPTKSGVMTNLNIGHEKVLSIVDPATYMNAAEKQFPTQFQIKSRDEITLFGEPAGRMLIGLTVAKKSLTEAMYILKHGDYIYIVTYTTSSNDFEAKRPMFEQSLQSLIINPAP